MIEQKISLVSLLQGYHLYFKKIIYNFFILNGVPIVPKILTFSKDREIIIKGGGGLRVALLPPISVGTLIFINL